MTTPGAETKTGAPHPGEFIRNEIIADLGLSVDAAAEILGVKANDLAALLNCETDLTPEMALRLEKSFSVGMRLLLGLQVQYEIAQMRAKWDEVEVQVFDWGRYLLETYGWEGEK